MKEIFAEMNTTCAVVKIRPEKIIQACTGSQDLGFTAQVVFITAKISFIFSVTNGNKISRAVSPNVKCESPPCQMKCCHWKRSKWPMTATEF